jgi:hypothetical protein
MTSPLRAVCDVARVASSATAIAMLDRALAPLNSTNRDSEPLAKVFGMSPVTRTDRAPLEREELQDALGRLGAARGIRRALFAVNFADGASGSPGESLSRLQIHRLHMPKPALQVRVPRGSGRYWDVDFGWEEEALFGEFDGFGKYHRIQMAKGKPPEQVVWEEKKRGPIDRPESYRSRRGAAGRHAGARHARVAARPALCQTVPVQHSAVCITARVDHCQAVHRFAVQPRPRVAELVRRRAKARATYAA